MTPVNYVQALAAASRAMGIVCAKAPRLQAGRESRRLSSPVIGFELYETPKPQIWVRIVREHRSPIGFELYGSTGTPIWLRIARARRNPEFGFELYGHPGTRLASNCTGASNRTPSVLI